MSPDDTPLLVRNVSRRIPRAELGEFLKELKRLVGRGRSIGCLITNDRELKQLNRRFRGKNSATDVLSFPSEVSTRVSTRHARVRAPHVADLGEIAISVERAAAQAAELGHSLTDELRILMLHGALHLAGYDHEKDTGEMARAEARWRKRFDLPIGLIERTNGKRHTKS